MKFKHLAFALMVVATPLLVRAAIKDTKELRTVPSIDLQRYAGRWYEVARYPNRFQKNCAGDVAAEYSLREDGKVNVVNRCRKTNGKTQVAEGVARVVNKETNAQLEVRFAPKFLSFLPFVWGDYYVIDLAPDYSYALVGSPDRKYLWILSRIPQPDEAIFSRASKAARANNFDPNRLVRTPQSAR